MSNKEKLYQEKCETFNDQISEACKALEIHCPANVIENPQFIYPLLTIYKEINRAAQLDDGNGYINKIMNWFAESSFDQDDDGSGNLPGQFDVDRLQFANDYTFLQSMVSLFQQLFASYTEIHSKYNSTAQQ